ncbi:MAG: ATP-binding cassette domain-containing protein [Clostridia bacterium]
MTFHIEAREKWRWSASNGAGKSTLFHILRGAMPPDEGASSTCKKNLRIGYLAQNAEISSAATVQEELLPSV